MNKFSYNLSEAASLTGYGRSTLYAMVARGDLKARKMGRRTVILAGDLRAHLENLPDAVESGAIRVAGAQRSWTAPFRPRAELPWPSPTVCRPRCRDASTKPSPTRC